MLCDVLRATGAPAAGCKPSAMQAVLQRLQTAQRFVLDAEFAAVAEALSDDYGGLVRAFPHCRLPYPSCWFEVAQADRPRFMAAGIQAPSMQVAPKRVGWLCTATRPDLSAWRTHLFWSLQHADNSLTTSAAGVAMDCDLTKPVRELTSEEASKPRDFYYPQLFTAHARRTTHPGWQGAAISERLTMAAHVRPYVPDYGLPEGLEELGDRTTVTEVLKMLFDLARSDWAGEIQYLLAVIGMLNARNATELVHVDRTKMNRARVRNGKLPFFEHKVLRIHHKRHQRVYDGATPPPAEGHAPMRQHFCRGHWKVRKTGIFFWSPHMRGNIARGKVEKDYALT